MYMEKFDNALKVYKKIVNTSYIGEENTLVEIYKFNEDFLEKHPEKIQSYFIIGYLKYKKESNYPDGLEYFEKFISASDSQDKYSLLRKKAEEYQGELKRIMKL